MHFWWWSHINIIMHHERAIKMHSCTPFHGKWCTHDMQSILKSLLLSLHCVLHIEDTTESINNKIYIYILYVCMNNRDKNLFWVILFMSLHMMTWQWWLTNDKGFSFLLSLSLSSPSFHTNTQRTNILLECFDTKCFYSLLNYSHIL